MKTALIQQHATSDKAENVARGLRAFETAARAGAELVCFAELAFEPFYPQHPAGPGSRSHAEPVPGPITDAFATKARALGGADLVAVPQAGTVGEWPEGLYEAEMRVAAFQNGYVVALCNRVGREEQLTFSGESFVCAPDGRVIARAAQGSDEILYADVD